jgi:hypothetical protein
LPGHGSQPLAKEFVAGFLLSSITGSSIGKTLQIRHANSKELEPASFIDYNKPGWGTSSLCHP